MSKHPRWLFLHRGDPIREVCSAIGAVRVQVWERPETNYAHEWSAHFADDTCISVMVPEDVELTVEWLVEKLRHPIP